MDAIETCVATPTDQPKQRKTRSLMVSFEIETGLSQSDLRQRVRGMPVTGIKQVSIISVDATRKRTTKATHKSKAKRKKAR